MDEVELFKRLVDRLHAKTLRKELNWGTSDGKVFEVYIGNGRVRLSEKENDLGVSDIIITVLDGNGRKTDQFDDNMLDKDAREKAEQVVYYPKMLEMYKLVRRQAIGADEVLRSIFDDLD